MFGLMGVARMSGQPGGAFSPLSLFASGEQGVWYDPSDFSSMFQDSGGTTPVTAVGQPVGRINDKSGNGNHATQATAAARPVVSARVNLLLATATLSTQSVTCAAAAHTVSFKGTGTLTLTGASTAGPLVGTGASDRVSLTFTPTAGSVTFTVSGSVTDAQLELGSTATRYQRVTTASDYDTVGFPHYLKFDGIDDSLATAAINFTVTNKMSAFVGYSLTSASLHAHIINLGNGLQGALSGGFWIYNADTPSIAFSYSNTLDILPSYTARSFSGLMSIGSQQVASALFDGDGTTYLTAIPYASNKPTSLLPSDVAGALENPSGTFGNLPFYLGRLFSSVLSGKIYQTVVLGRLASAAEINATEVYIASKSGVVL